MQTLCSSLTNKRYIMESLINDNKAFMDKKQIQVYKVTEENNKQSKVYYRCQSHKFFSDNYLRLVSKIQEQSQANLIKYFDYFKISDQSGNTKFYTISEYFDESHSLQSIMRNNMTQDLKLQVCEDVANGLDQILKFRYQHRSIQPCNIYFIDNKFKIGNFVESLYIMSIRLIDVAGNQLYWPQELKLQTENDVYEYDYDHTIDIFALACLMFEIFAEKPLFERNSDRTKIPQQQLENLKLIPQCEKQFIEAVITEGTEKRQKQFNTYLEEIIKRKPFSQIEAQSQTKGQVVNDQLNPTFVPKQIQQNIQPNQQGQKFPQNQPSIQYGPPIQQNKLIMSGNKTQFPLGNPQQQQNFPLQNPPFEFQSSNQNDLLQKTYNPQPNNNCIQFQNQSNLRLTPNNKIQLNPFQIQELKYINNDQMQEFEKYKKDKPEEKDIPLQISLFIMQKVREELNTIAY